MIKVRRKERKSELRGGEVMVPIIRLSGVARLIARIELRTSRLEERSSVWDAA